QPHRPNNTREIPLTQGKVTIVDAADYEWLSQWHWSSKKDSTGNHYAVRSKISMHRAILGLGLGDPRKVDHLDGNGLHNWRSNLRLATNSQNQMNRRKAVNNTWGFIGV